MAAKDLTVRFPGAKEGSIGHITDAFSCYLTDSEKGIALPVIGEGLLKLRSKDCTVTVRPAAGEREQPPFLVVSGRDAKRAQPILARMARDIFDRAPNHNLTIQRARAWFGLSTPWRLRCLTWLAALF